MTSEPAASASPPLISVVIPTRNERVTIVPLARAVLGSLDCTPSEVIVVDDNSPDGTAEEVAAFASTEPRVRLLCRDGKHGLASAVFHAAQAARGRFACILDADFSHDPAEIPGMLAKAQEGYDVVIGSRFVLGAANIGQPPPRRLASTILNTSARTALRVQPRDVLTGYVLCKTALLREMPTRYSARGFKWLLELLVTTPGLRIAEWPIVFQDRRGGKSKAGFGELAIFAALVTRLAAWRARTALTRFLP